MNIQTLLYILTMMIYQSKDCKEGVSLPSVQITEELSQRESVTLKRRDPNIREVH